MRQHFNWWKLTSIILFLAMLATVGVFVAWSKINPKEDRNPLPETIRSSLSFSPFVIPLDSTQVVGSNYKLTSPEETAQILTFNADYAQKKIVISTQIQPDQFNDIPEYKDRFLSNVISQESTVQTLNGTIFIGKQTQNKNKPVGVMLERGLIVFIVPEDNLTELEWRAIGESLEVMKHT